MRKYFETPHDYHESDTDRIESNLYSDEADTEITLQRAANLNNPSSIFPLRISADLVFEYVEKYPRKVKLWIREYNLLKEDGSEESRNRIDEVFFPALGLDDQTVDNLMRFIGEEYIKLDSQGNFELIYPKDKDLIRMCGYES